MVPSMSLFHHCHAEVAQGASSSAGQGPEWCGTYRDCRVEAAQGKDSQGEQGPRLAQHEVKPPQGKVLGRGPWLLGIMLYHAEEDKRGEVIGYSQRCVLYLRSDMLCLH